MVDGCRQLTGAQSGGDEDTAGMVTILTGYAVEDLAERSAPMKVCGKAQSPCQSGGAGRHSDAPFGLAKSGGMCSCLIRRRLAVGPPAYF